MIITQDELQELQEAHQQLACAQAVLDFVTRRIARKYNATSVDIRTGEISVAIPKG